MFSSKISYATQIFRKFQSSFKFFYFFMTSSDSSLILGVYLTLPVYQYV